MKYNHETNHSFSPPIKFWRSIEHLFLKFPFCLYSNKYDSRRYLIDFYEERTKEMFVVNDDDTNLGDETKKQSFKIITILKLYHN
ncbi:MAG: hypothetical protein V3V33_16830 [Candidatus Lokiarchaeia archaeon]